MRLLLESCNFPVMLGSLAKCNNWKEKRGFNRCLDCIPSEILYDIALRLPVNSIIQLKHTCKYCYVLLKDPKFADMHLSRATHNHGYLCATYKSKAPLEKMALYYGEAGDSNCFSASKIFEYAGQQAGTCVKFVSCGGLVATYSAASKCHYIFNPHVGERVCVPDDPDFSTWGRLTSFYFGYSSLTNEYKIVKVGIKSIGNGNGHRTGSIYTLGSGRWRALKARPFRLWPLDQGGQCDGTLFWLRMERLTLLDIASEKFSTWSPPPAGEAECSFGMVNMGDTIANVRRDWFHYKVWVLTDKINGTLVNMYNFNRHPELSNPQLPLIAGFWKNGGLVGFHLFGRSLFYYDKESDCFRVVQTSLDGSEDEEAPSDLQIVIPHIGNLVSPIKIMDKHKS